MTFEEKCYYTKFIKFLKDNDSFDKFKENWYNFTRFNAFKVNGVYNNKIMDFKRYFLERKPKPYCYIYIISDAFSWNSTPEGFDYWYNIDDLWREYFYENCYSKINDE